MEYIAVAIICFILGLLYNRDNGQDKLDTEIMKHLKQGRRVIVCVDSDATMFEMIGTKIRITKAFADFNEEPIELPIGARSGVEFDNLDDLNPDKSNDLG